MKFAKHIDRDGKSVKLSLKEYRALDYKETKETYIKISSYPRDGIDYIDFIDIIEELNTSLRKGNNGHSIFKTKKQVENTLAYLDTVREQILTESSRDFS